MENIEMKLRKDEIEDLISALTFAYDNGKTVEEFGSLVLLRKLEEKLSETDTYGISYQEKYEYLSAKVAELREELYKKDKDYFDERLSEIVCNPESCIEVIKEWVAR